MPKNRRSLFRLRFFGGSYFKWYSRAYHRHSSKSLNGLTIPRDIWFYVGLYLSVKSLYMLRATCREIRDIVDSHTVWLSALNDLMNVKPSVYSTQDIQSMSATQLREAALRMVLVDRAYSSPELPHRKIKLLSRHVMSPDYTQACLFPGGEQLLILSKDGSFEIYDIDAKKVVTYVDAQRSGWGRASSTARLFPISLHMGYIVVQASNRYGTTLVDGPVVAQEIRVYKYVDKNVQHILTEESPLADVHLGYAFCHQNGVLSLAQLQKINEDRGRFDVRIRTLNADGIDERTTKKIFIGLLEPERADLHSTLQILSTRYLFLQLHRRAMVFDISQFQVPDSSSDIAILHPIWTSPVDSARMLSVRASVVSYCINGRPPFVHVTFWAYPSGFCSMDLLLTDHEASGGISLSFADSEFPTAFLVDEHDSSTLFHSTTSGFSHGLLLLRACSMRYVSVRAPRMIVDREGLWSYTITRARGNDADRVTPGMVRLARENPPQARLGNAWNAWRSATTNDDELKQISVDDISGRFIQFKPPLIVQAAEIVLYAFD
ncbi:hypothetical protein BDY19DRAFT_995463 [Irpex rosettiformis]|uniref:Uncharacterized protein n=1 Tax=Irpex rosettiformis TaxID=378272 RepID=A0ACB8TY77_9APHY|nr:hypothetical protein BDY19DRAFT_995463 [Irpex rosettiformis]